ncbi:uncharacterized protein L969DRAFT_86299 [Mixia osmundae IAM 14324]|uniref:Uncharacterized protein n=1 Tax=Mixia osmundae (strain CBS 9802 / IAM 14324 / JCM 22182 / KY 12970) TaxID=764103 RepID=G7DUB5_MIXOS|nr:uncharacterized protein L969DRAFT_86299 [Mixia osmundae IAM 14324]KEI41047.1 hypothetical protein L969DRAFT_86299 [Mixia osmundae IAM 14324]GAA94175.1 hypothetical protein E5Q_00823 [Mixia osmundae IAM 14324]
MRAWTWTACLVAASALLVRAEPVPEAYRDLAKTTIELDAAAAQLDQGKFMIHISRVDDLLDDDEAKTVLLERISHIVVKLQLDGDHLVVNDAPLSMDLAQPTADNQLKASIVRATALRLPAKLDHSGYGAQELEHLTQALSVGLVGLQVRLHVEKMPARIRAVTLGGGQAPQEIEGASLRRVSLFITLVEVEGQALKHSTTARIPVVQMLFAKHDESGKYELRTVTAGNGAPIQYVDHATPATNTALANMTSSTAGFFKDAMTASTSRFDEMLDSVKSRISSMRKTICATMSRLGLASKHPQELTSTDHPAFEPPRMAGGYRLPLAGSAARPHHPSHHHGRPCAGRGHHRHGHGHHNGTLHWYLVPVYGMRIVFSNIHEAAANAGAYVIDRPLLAMILAVILGCTLGTVLAALQARARRQALELDALPEYETLDNKDLDLDEKDEVLFDVTVESVPRYSGEHSKA